MILSFLFQAPQRSEDKYMRDHSSGAWQKEGKRFGYQNVPASKNALSLPRQINASGFFFCLCVAVMSCLNSISCLCGGLSWRRRSLWGKRCVGVLGHNFEGRGKSMKWIVNKRQVLINSCVVAKKLPAPLGDNYRPMDQATKQPTNQAINQAINQPTNQPTNQLTNQSTPMLVVYLVLE